MSLAPESNVEQQPFPATITWHNIGFRPPIETSITTTELLDARARGVPRVAINGYHAALTQIENTIVICYPEHTMVEVDFNVEPAIQALPGPFMELGGPTLDNKYTHPLLSPNEITKKYDRSVLVTNIDEVGHGDEPPDLIMDAADLPLDDNSVGMFFASCLPNDVRKTVFNETMRTLISGGLFMYRNCGDLDVYHALSLGFELKAYSRYSRQPSDNGFVWKIVLQKPAAQPESSTTLSELKLK